MRAIVGGLFGGLGAMGLLVGLTLPVSADVLLQAGAAETQLVTAENHRPLRYGLTAKAGQTIVVRIKLANNNPAIVSRVAIYGAGKYTPLVVENQASYRTVEPGPRAQLHHLVVLTLPESAGGDQADATDALVDYEIVPLFDVEPGVAPGPDLVDDKVESGVDAGADPVDGKVELVPALLLSTVRYQLTVETASMDQKLLLEAQRQQAMSKYEDAVATYTRVINLNPDIADLYAQRGNAYLVLSEAASSSLTVQRAVVTDWETAMQLYEQAGHGAAANTLRSQLSQFVIQDE